MTFLRPKHRESPWDFFRDFQQEFPKPIWCCSCIQSHPRKVSSELSTVVWVLEHRLDSQQIFVGCCWLLETHTCHPHPCPWRQLSSMSCSGTCWPPFLGKTILLKRVIIRRAAFALICQHSLTLGLYWAMTNSRTCGSQQRWAPSPWDRFFWLLWPHPCLVKSYLSNNFLSFLCWFFLLSFKAQL